jgi:hypothetical protein
LCCNRAILSLWGRWNGEIRFGRRDGGCFLNGPPAVRAELILRLKLLAAVPTVPILLHPFSLLAAEQSAEEPVEEAYGELEHDPRDG